MSDAADMIRDQIKAEKADCETKMIQELSYMSNNRTCGSCKYFYRGPASPSKSEENPNGSCWRYPPTPARRESGGVSYLRPMVQEFHFCGEFLVR